MPPDTQTQSERGAASDTATTPLPELPTGRAIITPTWDLGLPSSPSGREAFTALHAEDMGARSPSGRDVPAAGMDDTVPTGRASRYAPRSPSNRMASSLSPSRSHGASLSPRARASRRPSLRNLSVETAEETTAPASPRSVSQATHATQVTPRIIGSVDSVPEDSIAGIPDNASTRSISSTEEVEEFHSPAHAHSTLHTVVSPSTGNRSPATRRSRSYRAEAEPIVPFRRSTTARNPTPESRDTQEISIRGLPNGLRLVAANSRYGHYPHVLSTQQEEFLATHQEPPQRREFQHFWRVWTGLFLILLLTIGWAIFFFATLRAYQANIHNRDCTFEYSPWFSTGTVNSRIFDNVASLPFLLFWGTASQLLPLYKPARVMMQTLTCRVTTFFFHLFLYKANIPWYAMLCISVAQWHYCRTDVTPDCPRPFIDKAYVFAVYSTLYVIFTLVGLHTVVAFWVAQEERSERQREIRARVMELENQIQEGRHINSPPIIQVGDLLRILLANNPRAIQGAPGLAEKMTSITWEELQEIDSNESECSICFIGFDEGLEIIRCPCEHFFHKKCLASWFEVADTCPLCRKSCQIGGEDSSADSPTAQISNGPTTIAHMAVVVGDSTPS